MSAEDVADAARWLAGGGAVLVTGLLFPKVWRSVRRLVSVFDVVIGRPERYPGDPEARPGLVETVDQVHRYTQVLPKIQQSVESNTEVLKQHHDDIRWIKSELRPNGGSSFRDGVHRRFDDLDRRMAQVEQRQQVTDSE